MSVQSEINRLKQNVSAAFTAIGNKGGTVPSSKVSGNLVNAINSIPSGVTVQRLSGSFTTDSNGEATVNCGFAPDLVIIQNGTDKEDRYIHASAPLGEFTGRFRLAAWTSDNKYILDIEVEKTSAGFFVDVDRYDWDYDFSTYSKKSFNYVAVKYS